MKMNRARNVISFLLAITIYSGLSLAITPALAQQSIPVSSAAEPSPQIKQSMPPEQEEVTILRDDFAGVYNNSTLANLAKAYWRLGAFDFDDDEAVGNFLKINDCKIYTEYLNDDLEWAQIIDVMRDHLKKSRDTFPLNFQFLLELHLGRYDPVLGGFPLTDKTGFVDSKRIVVNSINTNQEICHDGKRIKDYPTSVVALLYEPFTLDFLKLDEHVAQAYILRKKSEYSQLDEDDRINRYERDAYLRIRLTFSQYHGNLKGEQSETLAILYGTIDGYEVFEDAAQKRLMLSVDLKKQREEKTSTPMSVPVGPISPDETVQTPAQ